MEGYHRVDKKKKKRRKKILKKIKTKNRRKVTKQRINDKFEEFIECKTILEGKTSDVLLVITDG